MAASWCLSERRSRYESAVHAGYFCWILCPVGGNADLRNHFRPHVPSSIAAQLAQGATVQGNELTIINIYLSACAQYVAYAALLFFCGWLPRAMFKKVSTQMPATTELPVSAESDEDFLKWASGEPAQRE